MPTIQFARQDWTHESLVKHASLALPYKTIPSGSLLGFCMPECFAVCVVHFIAARKDFWACPKILYVRAKLEAGL
jgi:hypothetical protein